MARSVYILYVSLQYVVLHKNTFFWFCVYLYLCVIFKGTSTLHFNHGPFSTILQPQSVFFRQCWTEIAQKSWCPHAQVGTIVRRLKIWKPQDTNQKPQTSNPGRLKSGHTLGMLTFNALVFFWGDKVDNQNKGINHLFARNLQLRPNSSFVEKDGFWPMELTIWDCWQIPVDRYTKRVKVHPLFLVQVIYHFHKRRVPSSFLFGTIHEF